MIGFLYSIDKAIFFFINHTLSNPAFDAVMPFITNMNQILWVKILVLILWLWLMIRGGKTGRTVGILLILTIIFSDQLSSHMIKFWFARIRPCGALQGVRELVGCGSGYSFPSSHAVNNFAGATVIAYYYRKQKWGWYGFASLVAFTRPYVGVHYPSDILGGAIIGTGCGYIMIGVWTFAEKRITVFIAERKKGSV
jgi:undecaprenyl-diphosphatase